MPRKHNVSLPKHSFSSKQKIVQKEAEVLNSSDEECDSVGSVARRKNQQTALPLASKRNESLIPSGMKSNKPGSRHGWMKDFTSTAINNDEGAETDASDDEIINPYVMNPFNSARSSMLDPVALLPPSVEMSVVRPQQKLSLPPRIGSKLTSSSPNTPRTRSKDETLASFDPYGPSTKRAQHQLEMEIEFDGEESIEFIPSKSKNDTKLEWEGDFWSDDNKRSTEKQPLFSSLSSPFRNGAKSAVPSTSPNSISAPRQRRTAEATTAATAIFTSATEALFSRNITNRSDNGANVFGSKKLKSPRSNTGWGLLSYFRLFAITMAAFFALGTFTVVRHVYSVSGKDVSSTLEKSLRDGNIDAIGKNGNNLSDTGNTIPYKRPSSLTKKTEEAKKRKPNHWWNRSQRKNSKGTAGEQPPMEIYRNGIKDTTLHPNPPSATDANGTDGEAKAGQETLSVIKTDEDGTLLIKLPPPIRQEVSPPISGTASVGKNPPINNIAEDETIYIRLPYPEQRRSLSDETSNSKEELEPPMRGGSVPPNRSVLARRPPPIVGDAKGHSHHDHKDSHNKHDKGNQSKHRIGGYFEHEEHHPGVLDALRSEFHQWMEKHGRNYSSQVEKEHRFHVWKKNHFRITEKNKKHGPCRMTGKAVFGHNIFSDLDPEEFQARFLTGYRGPKVNENGEVHHRRAPHSHFRETPGSSRNLHKSRKSGEMNPPPGKSVERHHSIQRKLDEHTGRLHGSKYTASYSSGCTWWDVSCWLRWAFGYDYMGGTREPVYDEATYPSSLDWRSVGVVSPVHSQGSCGACWAITAVETVECAYAIATGNLIELSETEVIACDGTCEMCNGGWPQNAYEYVLNHGGLPARNSEYDGDWLYLVTAVLEGDTDEVSEYELSSYFSQVCPAGKREDEEGGSQSHHSGDDAYSGSSSQTRYANIKGYGYATDRCVCYTDGTGCDCDQQNEKTAVLNVASYGPAAVCLEASLWQDYEGGIMTADTGCSSAFLDMNHCVQVVGYAFIDSSEDGEGNSKDSNSGSGDGSHKSGSKDDSHREGYWIIKNQWSSYWGMNGYAYLAMGDNTCGVLNDMTQVYMKN